jgi:hypothetical protein
MPLKQLRGSAFILLISLRAFANPLRSLRFRFLERETLTAKSAKARKEKLKLQY